MPVTGWAELPRLVRAIRTAEPRCGAVRVVALDGGAAAGKSGLAALLARQPGLGRVAVLHTDDLLDGWAGQFDFGPRLRSQVLEPLAAGRAGRYQRYDWNAGCFTEWVDLAVPNTLVVEGVSAIVGCTGHSSIDILLDVERHERERRWVSRDGSPQPEWRRWLDAEDRFFAAHPPGAGVLVLRG